MSGNPFWLYETFNRFEAVAWFIIAIVIPIKIPRRDKRQAIAVFTASAAFLAFGITDILEAPMHANIPIWLWVSKIACATFLLICRYTYIGWNKFKLTDRYMIL